MAIPKYQKLDWKVPVLDDAPWENQISKDQIDAWLYGVGGGLPPVIDPFAGVRVPPSTGNFVGSGTVHAGTIGVGGAAAAAAAYAANPQQQRPTYRMDTRAMLKAIGMRLRIHESQELPFEFIFPHLHGETVFVFVIAKEEPVTLRDDGVMFPSDTLIAQLRLLMEAKV